MYKRKPIVGISLKLYINSLQEAADFAGSIDQLAGNIKEVEQFLFPSLGTIYPVAQQLESSNVGMGSQNIAPENEGPFTGEFSIDSLIEMGGTYVEIGHSERRSIFNESDDQIRDKVNLTLEKGLNPVLCIGETIKTNDFDLIRSFLDKQVKENLRNISSDNMGNLIIAYEPVWAIGAEEAAEGQHVKKVHSIIRDILIDFLGPAIAEQIRIIYGGSVSKDNVKSIVDHEDVDGVFVGRFGHVPENYKSIVEIVKKIKT